jgi:hypothetical protein
MSVRANGSTRRSRSEGERQHRIWAARVRASIEDHGNIRQTKGCLADPMMMGQLERDTSLKRKMAVFLALRTRMERGKAVFDESLPVFSYIDFPEHVLVAIQTFSNFRQLYSDPIPHKCATSFLYRAYISFSKRTLISTDFRSPGGKICVAYKPQRPTFRSMNQIKFGIPPHDIDPWLLHP